MCVSKDDLQSQPVCCPAQCKVGSTNLCTEALATTHICSDHPSLAKARDELVHTLCPRTPDQAAVCGKKVHKFTTEDAGEVNFRAPWLEAFTDANPSGTPFGRFPKDGLCNYVFIMPPDAGPGSTFMIRFNNNNPDHSRDTVAYYASFLSRYGDAPKTVGEMLEVYNGEWSSTYPQT